MLPEILFVLIINGDAVHVLLKQKESRQNREKKRETEREERRERDKKDFIRL